VWKWIKNYNWRAARARASEKRQKRMIEKVADEMSEIDLKHFQGFDAIFSLLMKRLILQQKKIKRSEKKGNDPEILAGDLQAFAAIMEKVQKGQRLAAGLDREREDSRVLEVLLPDFEGELKKALKDGSLPKAIPEDGVIDVEPEGEK
jgi:hypothetical protein